jgi:hypothetical protein
MSPTLAMLEVAQMDLAAISVGSVSCAPSSCVPPEGGCRTPYPHLTFCKLTLCQCRCCHVSVFFPCMVPSCTHAASFFIVNVCFVFWGGGCPTMCAQRPHRLRLPLFIKRVAQSCPCLDCDAVDVAMCVSLTRVVSSIPPTESFALGGKGG